MALAAVRHRGEMRGVVSLEELDQHIRLIGLCDVALETIDHDLELEVARLKNKALAKAAMVREERAALLAAVETFVENHREAVLGNRKTGTLNFGRVGYRQRPATVPLPRKGSSEMEDLCDRIESAQTEFKGAFEDVVILYERYVERGGGIKKLTDDELALLELSRKGSWDEFFVEPDRTKVTEVEHG